MRGTGHQFVPLNLPAEGRLKDAPALGAAKLPRPHPYGATCDLLCFARVMKERVRQRIFPCLRGRLAERLRIGIAAHEFLPFLSIRPQSLLRRSFAVWNGIDGQLFEGILFRDSLNFLPFSSRNMRPSGCAILTHGRKNFYEIPESPLKATCIEVLVRPVFGVEVPLGLCGGTKSAVASGVPRNRLAAQFGKIGPVLFEPA